MTCADRCARTSVARARPGPVSELAGRAVADVLADVVARGRRSDWLGTVAADCRTAVRAAGVGLVVADGHGPIGVVAATPGVGQVVEDLQFSLGEGPCRTASATGRTVRAPDLASDRRWPLFAREACTQGAAAAFSVPLQVGAAPLGVLDVYRGTPGHLTDAEQVAVAVYGEVAVAVLLLLHPGGDAADGAVDLAGFVDVRPVVHQAAGMVSVQLETDLVTAMLRLRARAFVTGRPLRDVAEDVVQRRYRFDDTPTGDRRTDPDPDDAGGR